jgi:hypothetical protein
MAHAQKPDFVFRRNGRVRLNRQGRQFSRLLAAEVCALAVVLLDTPCSEVVWRVLATHSIRQFSLHFPSRVSPCAITFQLDSTNKGPQSLIRNTWDQMCFRIQNFSDFRTAIRCMYRILRDIASTVLPNTLLFLQRNVWILKRRETKTDTTDTSSYTMRGVVQTSGFQSFSDFELWVRDSGPVVTIGKVLMTFKTAAFSVYSV